MNKGMNYQSIEKLVKLMERQPNTKNGYFNQIVAIKRMAKMAEVEDKKTFHEIKLTREDLEWLKKLDISPKAFKECESRKQEYINRLERSREAISKFRVSLGYKLIELCDELEDLATDHELTQVVGCNVNRMKEARKNYDSICKKGKKISFLNYALDIENIESNGSSGWKEGLLFDLLFECAIHFLFETEEGKEVKKKFTDHLIYEEGLQTYTLGADGELRENYPKPKLIVNNN